MASASPPPNRVAFPQEISEFKDDARIHFSKTEDRYHLEDEDGSEWEFNERAKKWLPVVRPLSHTYNLWAEACYRTYEHEMRTILMLRQVG